MRRTEKEKEKGEDSEPSEKQPYNIVNKDGKDANRTEAEDHKRVYTRILYPDILQMVEVSNGFHNEINAGAPRRRPKIINLGRTDRHKKQKH